MFPFPDLSSRNPPDRTMNRGMIADSRAGQTVPRSKRAAPHRFLRNHEWGGIYGSRNFFLNALSTTERQIQ